MKVKMKPKKAISSRFKVTGSGKLVRRKACKRHILTKKSSNRKRRLGKDVVAHESMAPKYARLMGV